MANLITALLVIVVAIAGPLIATRQMRKPARWLGIPFVWMMNRSHAALTEWALEAVVIEPTFTMLDIGCGGGATVKRLAMRAPRGRVYGVDYASGSVGVAKVVNAQLIHDNRVEIVQGSVSRLPFKTDSFDLAAAVETLYYWPDPVNDLREIRRVLKPGGTLVVVAETHGRSRHGALQRVAMKLMRSNNPSVDEERDALNAAGYVDIQMVEHPSNSWIRAAGRKPLS